MTWTFPFSVMPEQESIATMAQAQAEHIRNSAGRKLYCDGMFEDDREEFARPMLTRPTNVDSDDVDIGSGDIPY